MKIYVVSEYHNNHKNVVSHHATLKGAYHDVKDAINFLKGFSDGIGDIVGITKHNIVGWATCHMFVCTMKEREYDFVTFSILEEELGP